MEAKELMIGDWVQIVEPCKYAGAIGRIKTLIDHKDEENAYFKVFLQNNTIHIGIEDICSEDIRPIPLTPEILEKNGFRIIFDGELSVSYFQDIESFHIEVTVDKTGIYQKLSMFDGLGNGVAIVECKYVHQLQHALKLCGIKKEIEL